MSAASFRFRYLAGLLCHVIIAFFGCAGHPLIGSSTPQILGSCDVSPSFASSTALKRWDGFPVAVYVDRGTIPEAGKESYLEGIERGVGLWAEATRGRLGAFRINFDRPDSPVRISLAEGRLPDNALGTTEITFTGSHIVSAEVTLSRSWFEGTAFLSQDVASTTAHEMGHALGIVDHSPHPEDKMWVSGNFGPSNEGKDPVSLITLRDVNTLEQAYCKS